MRAYLRPVQVPRHLLWPVAWLYGAAVGLRNLMFDIGLLRSTSFTVPVISVGNLEMGGTGKSPLVLHVCQVLLEQGMSVALLSRGYGRSSRGFLTVDEKGTASDFGDEPMQAKLRFPDLTVAVCESRVEGIGRLFGSNMPPQVIVMDDAFQHRWVRPSLNLLITPGAEPFWHNSLFPVGSLREWASGSQRADALILAGRCDGAVPFSGPVFRLGALRSEPQPFIHFQGPLQHGDLVLLMSGIARPWRFRESAEQVFRVLEHQAHPDHHQFTERDIIALRDAFHSFDPPPSAVVITEKDAARLHNGPFIPILEGIPVFILRIFLKWEDNDETEFNQLILKHAGTDKGNG